MSRGVPGRAADCPWRDAAPLHLLASLSPEEDERYRAHLEGCRGCASELEAARAELAAIDLAAAGDALALPGAPEPPPELRARLMEAVSRGGSQAPERAWQSWRAAGAPSAPGLHTVPASEGWQPSGFEGIDVKPLSVDENRRSVTMLVRMAPGTAYPAHRHAGREECFVLEGRLWVAGRTLCAGDYQVADEGSRHGVQSTDEGCTLLIVSSQDDELV